MFNTTKCNVQGSPFFCIKYLLTHLIKKNFIYELFNVKNIQFMVRKFKYYIQPMIGRGGQHKLNVKRGYRRLFQFAPICQKWQPFHRFLFKGSSQFILCSKCKKSTLQKPYTKLHIIEFLPFLYL